MRQRTNTFIAGLMLALLLAACSGPQPGSESAISVQDEATSAAVATTNEDTTAVVQALTDTTDESNAAEAETTESTAPESEEEVARPEGWTEASHSNDADPDYDAVFPQDAVNTITITISPDDWAAMQADMTELLGEPGTRQRGGGGGRPSGSGQGDPDMIGGTPIWVPANIEMDGVTWNNVGIRYKGNSSLTSAWSEGTLKIPFKLDFDEFEDDYPEIDNQRFYGFKQLSFANGFSDDTYLRETVAYDLFQDAGIMSSETAFYNVVLDYGEEPVNLGIYTAVEVIDDTVISNALGDNDGNIYEADGTAASLAEGTYDQIADSFEKENNDDEPDWSDIEALYNVLHADTRTTDPEQWRADLEAIFDVDTFLNWLAVSAVMANWDTYGAMNHNYYLYNDPASGQLIWIPWDHNMVLSSGGFGGPGGQAGDEMPPFGEGDGQPPVGDPSAMGTPPAEGGFPGGEPPADGGQGGGPGGIRMPRGSVSLDKAETGDNWPLIRFLLDDPVYNQLYFHHLANASEQFDAETLIAQYQEWSDLLAPYIAAVGEEDQFATALERLITVTTERDTTTAEFVEGR